MHQATLISSAQCKMPLEVSPEQMMLEAALLLQIQPAVVCPPLLLPAAESSPGQAVVLMPHCSVELGPLVPAHMHECLPALPAAPQHVVLVHRSCMSLHVPQLLYTRHGCLVKLAFSTSTKQGQTLTCCCPKS